VKRIENRSQQTDRSGNDEHLHLLARVADRDRDALTELYRGFYDPLLRFIYRMTNDLEQAQECINDVMFVVWNKAGEFAGRSRVSTWIMGIAYRKALASMQRSNRWLHRFKAAEWHENIEPESRSTTLTDDLAFEDMLKIAMKSLTPEHRAVIELTHYYGYSYNEIAEIVDCPVNTVKTRMFHARARLRQLLPRLGRDDLQ
jgi:RNA polymerase sigma-70 factor (ECF subfamily)